MEFLAIFLSSLLLLVSPGGLIVDRLAENTIRSQFERVEQLQIRVDNAPSHQLLEGKVERIRIAGRGIWIWPEVRIDTIELETDPIDIDLEKLKQTLAKNRQPKLVSSQLALLKQEDLDFLIKPLSAGVRLEVTQEDVNRALQSPTVAARLRQFTIESLPRVTAAQIERYEFLNPQIEFLENNRLRFQIQLQQQYPRDSTETSPGFQLVILAESGLRAIASSQLELVEPRIEINGNPVPPLLLNLISEGFSKQFDLRRLPAYQIAIRLLQLEVTPNQMKIAAFIRLEPPTQPSAISWRKIVSLNVLMGEGYGLFEILFIIKHRNHATAKIKSQHSFEHYC